jgi:pilus assembly protein CpaF
VQPHVVALEARPANVEGRGAVPIRDLVRNSLRMRPDRIIVGECRGGEALDMLQAMNTGHDGSLTTAHANTPRDLLARLEVMVLMAGMELPVRAIREQIASAINIVVQQTRFSDGRRRVTSIVEIDGMEGDVILTQPLFEFKRSGIGPEGDILGEHVAFGRAPAFYEELEQSGVSVDRSVFAASPRRPRQTV